MSGDEFVQRVRERVEALGVGPVALAEKVGLERNFIRDILEGKKRSVRATSLTKLAEALETDPEWLSAGSLSAQGEQEREFILRYRLLSDRRRAILSRLMEDWESEDRPPLDGESE